MINDKYVFLQDKITNRSAHIAVIGLGYVGLPLSVGFARAGFHVVGVEVDERKVASLNAGQSYIEDVTDADLAPHVEAGLLRATADYDALHDTDAIFICVPTPYDAQRAPDLSFVRAAAEGIRPRLKPGQLIVLQSTTYPGTTEEVVQPILEQSGLKAGADFYLAFSPERIDPGNPQWSAYNTPKVVGGITPECTRLACDLLSQMGAPVHPVSSPRAAEMTKLLENIFRSVNIALVNELALLAERMGIDFWEVVEAAKTKPFGFMPFYPGAGVGGHCIPVDPYYLSWKAREYDFYTKFIELAAEVNQAMPYHAVDLVTKALSRRGRPVKGARILVLGVAFKPDVDDPRNSPAERVIELLLSRGARVRYHDPHVDRFRVGGDVFYRPNLTLESVSLTDEELRAADCVVIVTGHHSLDYEQVVEKAPLVVDCCNATASPAHSSDR
ncbi:MAG TPA: nucleotide sugar dehydrogenase, partial [Anaerolineae bacterium]|nr:nucleotide sugar dehydrogenase [Anaerolineae bacterium]